MAIRSSQTTTQSSLWQTKALILSKALRRGLVSGQLMSFLLVSEEPCLASFHVPHSTFRTVKLLPDWFPGAGFKRKAAYWKTRMQDFVNVPFQSVLGAVVSVVVVSTSKSSSSSSHRMTAPPFPRSAPYSLMATRRIQKNITILSGCLPRCIQVRHHLSFLLVSLLLTDSFPASIDTVRMDLQ